MNKTPVSYKQLDSEIRRAARNNKGSTVLLRCTKDSPHSLLVKALDLCNKYGMTNLAIFSL
jgi:biopolymer transport protein ExbD